MKLIITGMQHDTVMKFGPKGNHNNRNQNVPKNQIVTPKESDIFDLLNYTEFCLIW